MIQRTVVLNAIEPAPLSLRAPLGVALDLRVALHSALGVALDPTPYYPQFVLMPRSRGGQYAYDMETFDAVKGICRTQVPGSALVDKTGYNVELYLRSAGDPPIANTLAATGVMRLQGSAYEQGGSLSPLSVPVAVGPPGPPGPAGHRGSIWLTGPNPPTGGEEPPLYDGDMFLQDNGDVYRWSGAVWVLL